MTKLSESTREKLKGVSTPTLASALYKRGLRIQMIQDGRRLSAPTDLTLHQTIEIDVPIGCADAAVFSRDVIVGTRSG